MERQGEMAATHIWRLERQEEKCQLLSTFRERQGKRKGGERKRGREKEREGGRERGRKREGGRETYWGVWRDKERDMTPSNIKGKGTTTGCLGNLFCSVWVRVTVVTG